MRTKDSRTVLRGLGGSNAPRLPGGLATRKTAFFQQDKSLFYNDLAAMLPPLKKQYPFLAEVSSVPIQQALADFR
jgi:hypothetical protein